MIYSDLYFFLQIFPKISTVLCSPSYFRIFFPLLIKLKLLFLKKCILCILYLSGFSQRSRTHTGQGDLSLNNHGNWLSTLCKAVFVSDAGASWPWCGQLGRKVGVNWVNTRIGWSPQERTKACVSSLCLCL